MNVRLLIARIVLAAAAVTLCFAPAFLDNGGLQVATELLTVLVLAFMWNLLAGYADIMTIGQHAFVGVGAYAFFGFTALAGASPPLALLLAGATALAVSVPTLLVIFRLRAAYLSIGTWVVATVLALAASKIPGFGFGGGTSLPIDVVTWFGHSPATRYSNLYWLTLGLVLVAGASTYALLRAPVGLGLMAMRDNEEAAGSVGVNLRRTRTLCYLWTAPFLGIAGALIALQTLRIAPEDSFSITDWTVNVIFMVVIGGIGSFEGPIVGVVVFFVIRQLLSSYGPVYLIVLGVLSIAIMLIEPRGLWGALRRVIGDDVIPLAHRPPAAATARPDPGPAEA